MSGIKVYDRNSNHIARIHHELGSAEVPHILAQEVPVEADVSPTQMENACTLDKSIIIEANNGIQDKKWKQT